MKNILDQIDLDRPSRASQGCCGAAGPLANEIICHSWEENLAGFESQRKSCQCDIGCRTMPLGVEELLIETTDNNCEEIASPKLLRLTINLDVKPIPCHRDSKNIWALSFGSNEASRRRADPLGQDLTEPNSESLTSEEKKCWKCGLNTTAQASQPLEYRGDSWANDDSTEHDSGDLPFVRQLETGSSDFCTGVRKLRWGSSSVAQISEHLWVGLF